MTTLMIQGTTSDAGKSTLVAALCRCLKRRNINVVPFKPQNMALNSAVTIEGGEIGRAQALQAVACGLKPMDAVLESHARLDEGYEVVMVEGAGSPAEINLRDRDIANMGFAEAVDCPVILVADIDRGGVFAHLVGTLALLSESEQARIKGFVINRFRGDISLLQSGLDWLEEYTGKPVLGVLPYLHGLHLDAEDALPQEKIQSNSQKFTVVVPVVPRISNHTDFDPLRVHPDIDFIYVRMGEAIPAADLIILPGSKSVRADLNFLKEHKWQKAIQRHLRFGGKVFGICGGYQMLGKVVNDPLGSEGEKGASEGFSLLNIETTLYKEKQLFNREGRLLFGDVFVAGYEIHTGLSEGVDLQRPFLQYEADNSISYDGAISDCGNIAGTYWHGIFEKPEALQAILAWAGLETEQIVDFSAIREQQIDRLADAVEANMDMNMVLELLDIKITKSVQ